MKGRKIKQESRATEFRERLVGWKQIPESARPSLRELARDLGTSHQLLEHHLRGLEKWQHKELYRRASAESEEIRARAKAENRPMTAWEQERFRALERTSVRSFIWSAWLDQVVKLKEAAKKGPLHRLDWEIVELLVKQRVPGAQELLQKRAQIGVKEKKPFKEIVKAMPRHEGETPASWVQRIFDECRKFETNCPQVLSVELLERLTRSAKENLPLDRSPKAKSFKSIEGDAGNSANLGGRRSDAFA